MAYKDDLEAWWGLDETSGIRYDAHGSNDLADNATVLYGTGVQGNAADFELSNAEYLDIADNASLSVGDIAFTFVCWVKLETKAATARIMSKWALASNNEYTLIFSQSNDKFYLNVTHDGSTVVSHPASTLGSPSTGTWYFIVCWHDPTANTINIQINDGGADDAAHSLGVYNGGSNFSIGGEHGGGNELDGLVDEAAFWKRTLSTAEKTWLYNSGSGRSYSDLVTQQSTSGALTLSGAIQITTIWKRLFGGTVAISGALALKTLWKRALSGLVQFSGTMAGVRRQFQSIAGTLRFSLSRLQRTVFYDKVLSGTLTFSGTVVSRLIRFVVATVRLVLSPIAVIRTWLDPDADVDIV